MEWKTLLSAHRLGSNEPCRFEQDRTPFQRDFDRLIFSGSFRRLQDKTQVYPLNRNDFVRTRLTHSLETSSIARSLGTITGVFICRNYDTGEVNSGNIGAITAAAALAHDIGNPPFGHAGEEAVRYWFDNSETGKEIAAEMTAEERADFRKYDGNAQGFRVMSRLEMPDRTGGMQLTCATLGCFAKYPGSSSSKWKKCGFFNQDAKLFSETADHCGLIPAGRNCWKRHPLSFLLEAADDIAYLTVDFEDALRLGMIEYSELATPFLQIIDNPATRDYVEKIPDNIHKAEYLRAQVIGTLVRAVSASFQEHCEELLAGNWELPLTETIPQREILKTIRTTSTDKIYYHRSITEVIGAGFELLQGMLDVFVPCLREISAETAGRGKASDRSLRIAAMLPGVNVFLQTQPRTGYETLLHLLDYISGMTDHYAVQLYQKIKGISL